MSNILSVIGTQIIAKVRDFWAYDSPAKLDASLDEANIVTSRIQGTEDLHKILLDIDVPAYLIPSSTPGHSHLYIDVECDHDNYMDLLATLAACGVIEEGYNDASQERGFSALRLPWIKKEEPEISDKSVDNFLSFDPWQGVS